MMLNRFRNSTSVKNILEGYKQKYFAIKDSVTQKHKRYFCDESNHNSTLLMDLLILPATTLSQFGREK